MCVAGKRKHRHRWTQSVHCGRWQAPPRLPGSPAGASSTTSAAHWVTRLARMVTRRPGLQRSLRFFPLRTSLDDPQLLINTAMMSIATASIRIRPIRFGFAVDPQDSATLLEAFQVNTVLWGGAYNFFIPVFKKTPGRYRERYLTAPSATEIVNGLTDGFQPDFIVETKPGIANGIGFPRERIISIEQLVNRDAHGRCSYGVDIRSVCAAT